MGMTLPNIGSIEHRKSLALEGPRIYPVHVACYACWQGSILCFFVVFL